MSYRVVHQAMSRMHQCVMLLFPENLSRFQADIEALAETSFEKGQEQMAEMSREMTMNYGGTVDPASRKPFAFANGIAVIPIHGSLLNRFSGSYSGATGYGFIRSQLRAAMRDDDVKGIIFDVNSPGGEAAGCFELAAEIREANAIKPSAAVIDTLCASAAYALASASGRMFTVRSGVAGSIGVLMMHADVSQLLENVGVKISLLHSGKHKVDGNPFEPLSDDVRKDLQAEIDDMRADFVSLVAQNRGLAEKDVFDTEAKTYRGAKAVAAKLVDEVATVQDAVSTFMTALSGATQPEKLEMQTPEQQAAAQAAAAAATTTAAAPAAAAPALDATQIATAERERCNAIMSLDGAKTNPGLAHHLAFKTSMSVEDATAALAAAAPAQAAAAAAADPLASAMAQATGGKPVVEPGAEAPQPGTQAALMADFEAAIQGNAGFKPKQAA